MKRRDFLTLAASTVVLPALGPAGSAFAQSKPESLALMTWGGLWGNGMAEHVDAPFAEKTGVKIIQDRGSSPVERITKLKISLDNQVFDLVQLHDGIVPLAEAQGVLEDLDPNSPNLPFLAAVPDRFKRQGWVAMIYSALGIVYNPELVKTPPTSFADLWNEDYRGQIVLPEITHSIGPYMIPIGAMAAGKDAKDTEAGFDMLAKMNDLEPIWAKDTDSIMSALVNGEAAVGLLYKSQTFTVLNQGGNVEWVFPKEGAISYLSGTGIAKNTKNKELAEQYINATLDPSTQGWVANVFNYGGTHPDTLATLPVELQQRVQFSDAETARIIDLDHQFISANRGDWTDRWNRVIAGG
ncbi:MAG: extracellular solute-binding protein [Alphaproteobacteria bacterium]|jgi:putative spermidine/putrescine transport system substrate-binding protein|nr:extracellular solute-binding protein [Alphaproteobacteria bacterium]MBU1552231.1 extracellular solute-binding protein [Alphaproteobacteria bacterium]MBU2336861.1 extracellular solute-binding protein [Alphaproteobacteria bacterium]MBU2389617.1 extracellular solute-binding protein [Alphaproteobacteria bacterium]